MPVITPEVGVSACGSVIHAAHHPFASLTHEPSRVCAVKLR